MSLPADWHPYQVSMADGCFAATDSVTGLRVEDNSLSVAMGLLHRLMIDRRDELAARDPESLDETERRDLEHLLTYPDAFLQQGLWLARNAA